jgi:SAM-dependent methyltransferase
VPTNATPPDDDDLAHDGGWNASAAAWLEDVEQNVTRKMLDPLILRLCGDVSGRQTIDVGCGEGRFSRMLAERGASATGIDPTTALLTVARDRGGISPIRAIAEQMPSRLMRARCQRFRPKARQPSRRRLSPFRRASS